MARKPHHTSRHRHRKKSDARIIFLGLIILVVAMLVTPAATAQLLTVRFSRLVGLAVLIGAGSAVVGLYLSYWFDVASGATIVLAQSALFLIVLLLGPNSGLLARRRPAVT